MQLKSLFYAVQRIQNNYRNEEEKKRYDDGIIPKKTQICIYNIVVCEAICKVCIIQKKSIFNY